MNLNSCVSSASDGFRQRKQALRKEKIALRRAIDPLRRRAFDAAICANLEALPGFDSYESYVAYISDGSEPDLHCLLEKLLAAGKTLCLPRFAPDGAYDIVRAESLEFNSEKWGIPEPGPDAERVPASLLRASCWLVPGVAFDESGTRLGRGKGIYDRLLASGAAFSAGIFYECQKCAEVPFERHDHRLNVIVSEAGRYCADPEKNGTGN